jgi:hypothetical protein
MRAAVATLLALTLLASSGTARAEDAARERERAALYQQGVDLAAAGNWAQAVERFKRVVELRASTKALYTLGEAEEHTGQLAAAKRSYRASLDSARAGAAKDIVDLAGAALGKLEGRVPQVSVRLDEKTAAHGGDTHASIDGQGVPIGAASDVDPGEHEVRVEATGAAPFVRKVHAVEGQQLDVAATLEWGAVAPASPPPPPQTTESSAASRILPLVAGGVGLAVGITGLVVRLKGQSDYDAASAHCTGGVCASQNDANSGNDARGQMILGTTFLCIGAAVAAGAAVYWFVSRRPSSTVQAGALVDGAGARAVLRGTF